MRNSAFWGRALPALVVTVLLAAASGCGSDDKSSGTSASTAAPAGENTTTPKSTDKITVVVSPGPSEDALKAVAPGFTSETGIAVDFVEIPYGDLLTKLLLSAKAGKSNYDVVQYDGPMIRALTEVDGLAKLDDLIAGSPAYDGADFSQKLQDYAKSDDGQTYGLPLSTEPYLLWYRTDLFDKLGLKVPTTWEEYTANAKALDAAGYDGSLMVYGPKESLPWFLQMLRSHGTEPWNEKFEPDVESPAGVAAMKTFMDLVAYTPDSALTSGADDITSTFIQQDVGQMIQASGYYSIVNDPAQSKVVGKFGIAEPPNDGTHKATMLYGWLIGMMKTSPNQAAGWKFLEYALGKTGVRSLVAEGAPPPGRKSLLEDPTILKDLPYLPTMITATEYARTSDRLVEGAEVSAAIAADVNDMAAKGTDPAAGAKKIDADITDIFKKSGRL